MTAYTPGPSPCAPAVLPLTLQAKTGQAIVVTGIKVTVLTDAPAAPGEQKPSPGTCASSVHQPIFAVNLTQAHSPVVPTARKARADVTDFPFTVSADDPRQLTLRVDPENRDVRFSLKVEWVADGEYGSTTLDNSDRSASGSLRTEGPGYHVTG